jgi:GPH family glycoside/pentoside/hexuronide:cation symporter
MRLSMPLIIRYTDSCLTGHEQNGEDAALGWFSEQPVLIFFFILFYNVPAMVSDNGGYLFIYMMLTYILTGTLDSLINANYGALFPELFPDEKVRAKTNAMRQAFQLVAMVISIALTPMITARIGYILTSVLYGVFAFSVRLYCSLGCHDGLETSFF